MLTFGKIKGAVYLKGASVHFTEINICDFDALQFCAKITFFRQHMDRSEMLIRGMNVVVLNEVTGAVMSSRWYDTYESRHDSKLLLNHLQGLKRGRILCFAIKVSATIKSS